MRFKVVRKTEPIKKLGSTDLPVTEAWMRTDGLLQLVTAVPPIKMGPDWVRVMAVDEGEAERLEHLKKIEEAVDRAWELTWERKW